MSVSFNIPQGHPPEEVPSAPAPTRDRHAHAVVEETLATASAKPEDDTPQPPRNIFEAAERGMVGWIVKTVERNIEYDVNQRDRLSRTALHWASEMGHLEAVEALLDYGCDPKLADCNGRTAIHYAAREGHVEVLKTLMENMNTDQQEYVVNQSDNYGITPVFLALQRGKDAELAFEHMMTHCGGKYNVNNAPKLRSEDVMNPGGKRPSSPGSHT
mmetsp:Transcript_26142/g.57142  ORF Transcript_26142/g.57142 Transcript_26142/m.57142 type:complete len:215 (+) Transcript_26142:65-709(+)|eukprot:CAMPEP_0202902262 /NCGR_PEP_ID=MMETSP1392-20130828/16756_1 /ASSEMBLY_ACC=CAM_ASM_000868 /TAXON_ID=225041 /ORGANISM="Chlamydomonas chlamydogama, Strain SAG 11-48b" /LENGTH=214 /DNA_ID=CAMNT_0049589003 /DNA_START=42 /DNA_END=686 /DNA_ORIENTATION=+